jgi:adenylate kinase family enzyme
MSKPLVVIVSGAFGSGKAAFAVNLASYMKLPLIERDTILKGLEYTKGAVDKVKVGIPVYYTLLKSMLDAEISFVTNETLYKNISEEDVRTNIIPYATTINVHIHAAKEKSPEEMKTEKLKKIYDLATDPLDLGVPVINVVVSDDYNPQVSEVAARIRAIYTGEPRDLWDAAGREEI